MINGGSHAGNKLAMQEFMVLPVGAESFKYTFCSQTTIFFQGPYLHLLQTDLLLHNIYLDKYGGALSCNIGMHIGVQCLTNLLDYHLV